MEEFPVKAERLNALIRDYFDACDATAERVTLKSGLTSIRQVPYTLAGLAEAIGVDKRRILEFCGGEQSGASGRRAMLCQALRRIERYIVERLLMGELTNAAAMLLLRDLGYGAPEAAEDGGRVEIVMDDPNGWGD